MAGIYEDNKNLTRGDLMNLGKGTILKMIEIAVDRKEQVYWETEVPQKNNV